MAQGELTHLSVTCGYSHAGLENLPLHFLESLLWEVGTSTGSILKSLGFAAPPLLSEQVFCCPQDPQRKPLCLAAHHVPRGVCIRVSEGLSPQQGPLQLSGDRGVPV